MHAHCPDATSSPTSCPITKQPTAQLLATSPCSKIACIPCSQLKNSTFGSLMHSQEAQRWAHKLPRATIHVRTSSSTSNQPHLKIITYMQPEAASCSHKATHDALATGWQPEVTSRTLNLHNACIGRNQLHAQLPLFLSFSFFLSLPIHLPKNIQ